MSSDNPSYIERLWNRVYGDALSLTIGPTALEDGFANLKTPTQVIDGAIHRTEGGASGLLASAKQAGRRLWNSAAGVARKEDHFPLWQQALMAIPVFPVALFRILVIDTIAYIANTVVTGYRSMPQPGSVDAFAKINRSENSSSRYLDTLWRILTHPQDANIVVKILRFPLGIAGFLAGAFIGTAMIGFKALQELGDSIEKGIQSLQKTYPITAGICRFFTGIVAFVPSLIVGGIRALREVAAEAETYVRDIFDTSQRQDTRTNNLDGNLNILFQVAGKLSSNGHFQQEAKASYGSMIFSFFRIGKTQEERVLDAVLDAVLRDGGKNTLQTVLKNFEQDLEGQPGVFDGNALKAVVEKCKNPKAQVEIRSDGDDEYQTQIPTQHKPLDPNQFKSQYTKGAVKRHNDKTSENESNNTSRSGTNFGFSSDKK